jgi:hypothetical protein
MTDVKDIANKSTDPAQRSTVGARTASPDRNSSA